MALEFLQSPLCNTMFIFISVAVALYLWKPQPMFDKHETMCSFGFGKGKTCFTYSVVTFSVAMIVYSLFTIFLSEVSSV